MPQHGKRKFGAIHLPFRSERLETRAVLAAILPHAMASPRSAEPVASLVDSALAYEPLVIRGALSDLVEQGTVPIVPLPRIQALSEPRINQVAQVVFPSFEATNDLAPWLTETPTLDVVLHASNSLDSTVRGAPLLSTMPNASVTNAWYGTSAGRGDSPLTIADELPNPSFSDSDPIRDLPQDRGEHEGALVTDSNPLGTSRGEVPLTSTWRPDTNTTDEIASLSVTTSQVEFGMNIPDLGLND
ncbi:MAG TPA: hypothetical protein VIY86_01995, partial [Pirellulaceae bacterium]